MKKFFLLIIFFNLLINNFSYSSESYVVIKVNNNIITNIDINDEYRYLIALNQDLKNINKIKIMKLAKDSIIREKIKENELIKYYDLSQENKFIDKIIENFYKKLEMNSEEEFKIYLLKNNLVFKNVKYKISIEAAWNDLIYKKFSNKIDINEKKIENEIKELIINKKKQNIYLLSEILFVTDKSENIQKKYEKIVKSISEIGFKNTANIYSVSESNKLGGQIGWIKENQLSKIIKKKISKLKIGEYTKPISIPGGLLIINLDNKKTQEEKINFSDEFNKQIIFEKNEQLDKFSTIYFNKIKKNSLIYEK